MSARRHPYLLYVPILLLGALFMGPFLWTVGSSFKHPTEIYVFPPLLWPSEMQWQNWREVWTQVPFARFARNSVVVTGAAVLGQILSTTLVAYGFARFRFPTRDFLFMVVLSTMILPFEVLLIPQFLIFRELGWLDSYKPLIVPFYFGAGPFFIFLMRQFFLTIPLDLDQSARLDGAHSLRILWSIILPLSRPALATVAIFSFLANWDSFLGPLIYLNTMEKYTLPLGLRFFQLVAFAGGAPREHLLMAASLTVSIPGITLFVVAQKYFVRGIVLSGIKG